MRNLIPILLALVVLSSGCDCDGYSCTSEGCYADDDSPQYQTLEDCLSVCDEFDSNSAVFETCGDQIAHDGYNYSTVQIGDQCWFAENCRYLPEVSSSSYSSQTSPYYYVYDYQGTDDVVFDFSTPSVAHEWPYANSTTRATVTTVPFSAYRFTVDGRKEQLWVTFEDLDGDN